MGPIVIIARVSQILRKALPETTTIHTCQVAPSQTESSNIFHIIYINFHAFGESSQAWGVSFHSTQEVLPFPQKWQLSQALPWNSELSQHHEPSASIFEKLPPIHGIGGHQPKERVQGCSLGPGSKRKNIWVFKARGYFAIFVLVSVLISGRLTSQKKTKLSTSKDANAFLAEVWSN